MAASSSDWPVHQLWPHSGGKQSTELDVVLFHGLQFTANDSSDAWRSTWTPRGHDNVCWPQEWLPFDLGEAVRIFSLSYNAHVENSPHHHVSEIAHNLFQTLMNPRYEWDHPIVLIGHSFGGLVLKSLLVKLKRESTIRNRTNLWSKATVQNGKVFLRNVRGVAFYGVPHAGSSNIAVYVNKLLRCNNRHHRGIMHNIEPWQRDMEQLSVDFDDIVNENNINIYAFCEGRPMKQVGILVHFGSAQRSAGNNSYMVEDADHMEVCKPPSKEHPSYWLLLQFIITCAKVARECDQALQEVHDLPQSTFGLESYVERVEMLDTSEGRNAAPRYVGVCGMGGVGKTLLLQRVYGSPKVHGHFQGAMFIWVTVGQTPNIMALYRRLSEELGIKPESNANAEDYKLKLHSQFRGKRVFLVLDDVWKEKAFDSLDLAKGDGSVTLLTTRNQSLLERASPHINQEHMSPLSKEDGWSLFCVHAFRPPSNVPCELKALAQSMAEECQGLPLALKVIGRAMFGKTSPEHQCEPLLKKLRESRMQERTVEEDLYERLKLGYDLLLEDDWRLKDCFLYFAGFPEDYKISFVQILWDWRGEGLVPGNGGDDPTADAFSLLDKLWRRSFIESDAEVSCENEDLGFTVHDVMRDLAFYILENDSGTPPAKQLYLYRAGQNLEEIPREWKAISKALRLSLRRNKLKTLPGSFDAPELVSLVLGQNPIRFVPESFLSNFPKLRVLDLSWGEFWNLPEELGDLKDLVCLDLTDCRNLQSLPDAVGKLHALKRLNLDGCQMLNYLPSGVVGLTSLQILYTGDCVGLTWAEHTSSGMARAEALGDVYPTIGASLEDICGLVVLTELTISGEEGPRVELPHNISALTKLKVLGLYLNLKTIPAEMPYWLIQLQKLYLCDIRGLEYLPRSFTCCGAFPALITFKLHVWTTLLEFPEVDEGALPKLQTLDFSACESLRTLPRSLELLTSLRKLIVADCDRTLQDFCRTNCEKSSIWRKFDIQYLSPWDLMNMNG
ncbi:hypothetical protein CY35_03G140900 [Sphagnum magellanicum]|nr:hypothetical protein CY35_03G140900 [Sphagnum magellanicum]KAH9569583.1 hypothetical protein CY35_03G140900 [Sphagnum magellanicum]